MESRVKKVEIGPHTLYCGDAKFVLPTLSPRLAIVSDPPYGIAFKRGEGGKGKHTVRNIEAIAGDERSFDPRHLLAYEHVIVWGANHYAQRLPHGSWLAWDKLAGLEPYDSFSDVEFAWRNGRRKDVIYSHLWKGICKDSEKGGKERWHPTQKPTALMEWCIRQLPESAVEICDPYMGSGTTGVACARLGRRFIGVEIEPRYFDIACRRIEEATRQSDLFIEQPKREKPEQWNLELK